MQLVARITQGGERHGRGDLRLKADHQGDEANEALFERRGGHEAAELIIRVRNTCTSRKTAQALSVRALR